MSVDTGIIGWLRGIYGELRICRGKKHEYMGMDLNYSVPGNAIFSVEKYTRYVITEFPEDLGKTAETPMAEYLFTIRDNNSRQPLTKEQVQAFYQTVAQLLFLVRGLRRNHDSPRIPHNKDQRPR